MAQHTKDVTSPQTDKCKHHQLAFWGRGTDIDKLILICVERHRPWDR